MKTFIDETDKQEEKQNKILINQLAKTIEENSKTLAEFGMAHSIIAKIKSMIPLDLSSISKNDKNLKYNEKNTICKNDDSEIRIDSRNAKSAIFPPIGNWDNNNKEGNPTDKYDSNRVF